MPPSSPSKLMGSIKTTEINGQDQRPHVAFLSFPFRSHAFPIFNLARLLASTAPYVLFTCFGTAKSNAAISTIPRPDNLRLYAVDDGLPEGFVPSSSDSESEVVGFFMRSARDNFAKGMEEQGGRDGVKVSCLVSDGFLWFVGDMAEELALPWVALHTSGACSLAAFLFTDDIRREIGTGDEVLLEKGNQRLDNIPGLSFLKVSDLPEGIVAGENTHPFLRLLRRRTRALPRATAVIINTFDSLESNIITNLQTKINRCLPMGPLKLLTPALPPHSDRFSCLSWLDRYPPSSVSYVSFGTQMSPPPSELAELADALEGSGIPFLWSLKDKFLPDLPEGFLSRTSDRALVVSWAPQMEILTHPAVGVFLTHGGWNSVTESVIAGVPIICRPFQYDQMVNSRMASELWGIGLGLDHGCVLTKDWAEDSLNKVVRSEEGKTMREKARRLKELAMAAASPEGSSMKSLAVLVDLICGNRIDM